MFNELQWVSTISSSIGDCYTRSLSAANGSMWRDEKRRTRMTLQGRQSEQTLSQPWAPHRRRLRCWKWPSRQRWSSTTSQLSCKENGFEPVRLSLTVPWCATSHNLEMLNGPRCRLDALKKFPDSSGFLSMLESSTLVRQDSQPLARLLEAH